MKKQTTVLSELYSKEDGAFRGWLQSNDTTVVPQVCHMTSLWGPCLFSANQAASVFSCVWKVTFHQPMSTCRVYTSLSNKSSWQFWQSHKSKVHSWHTRIYYKGAVVWRTLRDIWWRSWWTHLGNGSLYGHRVDSGHRWVPSLGASWKDGSKENLKKLN